MPAQFWIFLGALSGGLAVAAGAIGAHALSGVDSSQLQAYHTAQMNHAIHSVALVATGIVLLYSQGQGRGRSFSSLALQVAAAAFVTGIVLFAGGIYAHVAGGIAFKKEVPVGGVFLMAGWAALAIGALGIRR
jgi:uncharacterized membrane protein YgdD (TMEM256/DUF423 family)